MSFIECWKYWKQCKDYWMKSEDEKTAIARAYWWDCREVWDIDSSWTPEKILFCEVLCIIYDNPEKPQV